MTNESDPFFRCASTLICNIGISITGYKGTETDVLLRSIRESYSLVLIKLVLLVTSYNRADLSKDYPLKFQ